MSTAPQFVPSWKQEVNRRLAEHQNRRPHAVAAQPEHDEAAHLASRRAREAAARVAARYAHAPSYSDMLANEARAAIRAADAASQAAFHAKAAAQSVLDGIVAASAALPALHEAVAPAPQPRLVAPKQGSGVRDQRSEVPVARAREIAPLEHHPSKPEVSAPTVPVESVAAEKVSVRWDEELPSRPAAPVETHATLGGHDLFEDEWWKLAPVASEPEAHGPVAPAAADEIEMVEPAKPIPGNLIEFPRELVAARKARPRLAESPQAEPSAQLSIFEVDPGELPTQPVVEAAEADAHAWTAPAWSGIELDTTPHHEELPVAKEKQAAAEPEPEEAPAPVVEPASAGRRLMAVVVDGALIAGSLMASAVAAAVNAPVLPDVRTVAIGAAAAMLVFSAAYMALFFTLGRATPGMKYAGLELHTLENETPTRAQRCARLMAMLLSVLPAGLGMAWSLFDDDHLSWHDRLSRTYLAHLAVE